MFNAKAIVTASAALALAACSGVSNLAPRTVSAASPSMRATSTFPSPESPGLLYVAIVGGTVNIYDQIGTNQKPIDQLTGFATVRGLHVAANGDVSVSDQNSGLVSIYHQGAHTPFKQLTLSNPGRIAVDSKGTVYVNDGNSKTVYVFANGSTKPTSTLTDSFNCATTGVAIDGADDLFVSSGCGVIDEFVAGQTTPTSLGSHFGVPMDIAVDHDQNLIVTDVASETLTVYAPPYNQALKQVSENGDVIYAIALGRGDKALWYADSTKQYAGKWSYPGLNLLPAHTSALDTTLGAIAAYPPGGN